MTDTDTSAEAVERYARLLDTGDLILSQPSCADLLRALLAERDRLRKALEHITDIDADTTDRYHEIALTALENPND